MSSNAIATESERSRAGADKPVASLNWRQRKKLVARRQQEIDRRKELVDGYVQLLGGNVTALVMMDISRAVDLIMLSDRARAAALRGEESLGNVTRLEIQASKAVRRLNLPAAGAAAAPPVQSFADYIAGRQASGDD